MRSRKNILLILFLVISTGFLLSSLYIWRDTKEMYERQRKTIQEFEVSLREYLKIRPFIESIRSRRYTASAPPEVTLERIMGELGVQSANQKIRTLSSLEIGNEKVSEIGLKLEGLRLREAYRVIERLEDSREGFLIKELRLAREFNSPERVKLQIRLLAIQKG